MILDPTAPMKLYPTAHVEARIVTSPSPRAEATRACHLTVFNRRHSLQDEQPKMKRHFVVLCVGVTLVIGCTTNKPRGFAVSVNAFVNKGVTNAAKSYIILSADKGVSTNDLEFQEYATFLARALGEQGFAQAAAVDDADMAVFLKYGIGEPQEHAFTYSLPTFGQTGVSSATTYGRITGAGYGSATYSGTTYYTPTFGITGHTTHVGTYVTYTRHAHVSAFDLRPLRGQKEPVQLWKTGMISVGASDDLREVVPAMIAAAMEFFGRDTQQSLRIFVPRNDSRIRRVKGLPPEPTVEQEAPPGTHKFSRGAK